MPEELAGDAMVDMGALGLPPAPGAPAPAALGAGSAPSWRPPGEENSSKTAALGAGSAPSTLEATRGPRGRSAISNMASVVAGGEGEKGPFGEDEEGLYSRTGRRKGRATVPSPVPGGR